MPKGRPRKPDHLRQRKNKVPGGAQLPTADSARRNTVPELPQQQGVTWRPEVVEWWISVWQSPMAAEYLDADMKGGLFLLAALHQARWEAETAGELVKIASEIRQQEVRFGLSPIDRSRLRWTIEQGETAAERTESRRAAQSPKLPRGKDPRAVLKMA